MGNIWLGLGKKRTWLGKDNDLNFQCLKHIQGLATSEWIPKTPAVRTETARPCRHYSIARVRIKRAKQTNQRNEHSNLKVKCN